ncbi:MAG: nucleoside triphosphate pyrophosphohydrolase [Clostridium sp.]
MIKIIGLGPGNKESLTLGTIDILKGSHKVYFRTEIHPTIDYIKTLNVNYETYDNKYECSESFDQVYSSIAQDLIAKHTKYSNIVYGVPGHPLVAEKSVSLLLELCDKEGIETEIIPAVSFVDAIMESLRIDPVNGLKIIDAFDIENQILDNRLGIVVTQVYNNFIASEVKIALSQYYDEEAEIYFVRAAGIKALENIRKIKILELDRQDDIDYLTSLYVPKGTKSNKDFYDLLDIMKVLRGNNGCPWDLEQSHETLKKNLVEECYEVIEAIEEQDDDKIVEELGDLLLQVVFHAQIGKDEGYFNINDVTQGICEKMIRRHPHIFSEGIARNSEEVLENWDNIKETEHNYESYTDELRHVAKTLPGLMRAHKVQKKAAKFGFDWKTVEPALDKVKEEYYEVLEVYKSQNRSKILEELGDLLFATVNVTRFLDIDPESAINYTVDKFIKRFEFIEKSAMKQGRDLKAMTLEEMDELWEECKKLN